MDPHFVYFSFSPSLCVVLVTHPPDQLRPHPLSLSLSLSLHRCRWFCCRRWIYCWRKRRRKTSGSTCYQRSSLPWKRLTHSYKLVYSGMYMGHLRDIKCPYYLPLFRCISMGQNQVSFIERCPLFRGVTNVLVWGRTKVTFIERCPLSEGPFSVSTFDPYLGILTPFYSHSPPPSLFPSQELCISLIPSFATTVDYSSMKHSIIPRLTALMVSCESVSVSSLSMM